MIVSKWARHPVLRRAKTAEAIGGDTDLVITEHRGLPHRRAQPARAASILQRGDACRASMAAWLEAGGDRAAAPCSDRGTARLLRRPGSFGPGLRARPGPPDLPHHRALYIPCVRKLRSLPMPVICAVNGVAAGAGANIALACDIVLAARPAKFHSGLRQARARAGFGGTWFLPRLVGEARARGALHCSPNRSGGTGRGLGLIWKAVDDAEPDGRSASPCGSLCDSADGGLALIEASARCLRDEQSRPAARSRT